jgi:hypothetical protein
MLILAPIFYQLTEDDNTCKFCVDSSVADTAHSYVNVLAEVLW